MVRVIRLDVLRVEAFVNGTMHGLELLNRPVRFSLANAKIGPETYAGRVVFVSPEVHPVTDQIRIWAEIVNPALKLKPGMRGTLEVDMPASADSDE